MSDRKYRQRGYQDSGNEPQKPQEKASASARRDNTFGPRPLNMPGTHSVSRCAQCGNLLQNLPEPVGQCPKCGFELHSCKQCAHFDPSARFECNQTIAQRISPKDTPLGLISNAGIADFYTVFASTDPAAGGMFRRWPFFQRLLSL